MIWPLWLIWASAEFELTLPLWVFVAAVVLSTLSNLAASRYIKMMTDVQFRAWTQRITLAIGVVFLARGMLLWLKV